VLLTAPRLTDPPAVAVDPNTLPPAGNPVVTVTCPIAPAPCGLRCFVVRFGLD